jgi:hypothetical protein
MTRDCICDRPHFVDVLFEGNSDFFCRVRANALLVDRFGVCSEPIALGGVIMGPCQAILQHIGERLRKIVGIVARHQPELYPLTDHVNKCWSELVGLPCQMQKMKGWSDPLASALAA